MVSFRWPAEASHLGRLSSLFIYDQKFLLFPYVEVMYLDGFPYRVDRLDIKEDREWVKSRLDERGRKPFDFVQNIQPFNPSQRISNPSITSNFSKIFFIEIILNYIFYWVCCINRLDSRFTSIYILILADVVEFVHSAL